MQLDDELSVTYYGVFDGHGGEECAKFLKEHLHIELKKCFLDSIDGIKDSEDLNESLIKCVENSFETTDTMYKK
jgi:serine/threonine protein phosphatase PrpC